jgi:hypothetical protein
MALRELAGTPEIASEQRRSAYLASGRIVGCSENDQA